MSSFKSLRTALLTLVAAFAFSGITFAAQQDFDLINNTGRDIVTIKICESTSKQWSDNLLGKFIMLDDTMVNLRFDDKNKNIQWDIQATFPDGKVQEYKGIDLSKVTSVTLNKNGTALLRMSKK